MLDFGEIITKRALKLSEQQGTKYALKYNIRFWLRQLVSVLGDFQDGVGDVAGVALASEKHVLAYPDGFFAELVVAGVIKFPAVFFEPFGREAAFEVLGIKEYLDQAVTVLRAVTTGAGDAFGP